MTINYPKYYGGLVDCSVNEYESQVNFLGKKKSEAEAVTFDKFTNKPFLRYKAKLSHKIFSNYGSHCDLQQLRPQEDVAA